MPRHETSCGAREEWTDDRAVMSPRTCKSTRPSRWSGHTPSTRGSRSQSDLHFSFAAVQLRVTSCLISVQRFCTSCLIHRAQISPKWSLSESSLWRAFHLCVCVVRVVSCVTKGLKYTNMSFIKNTGTLSNPACVVLVSSLALSSFSVEPPQSLLRSNHQEEISGDAVMD